MVIRFSDKLSDDVLAAFYRETALYIGHYPVRTAFIDFSDVTGVDVSTAIVQRLAKTPPLLSDPMPRVIIAPSDQLFDRFAHDEEVVG